MTKSTPQSLLRKWLDEQGFSFREAGALLGCTGASVSNYASGASRPDIDRANAIARVVGIPTSAWSRKP